MILMTVDLPGFVLASCQIVTKLGRWVMVTGYFSAEEAASFLEVSSATVRNWTKSGLLFPAKSTGKSASYAKNHIVALKDQIESGEVKRLDRRANKTRSRATYGLLLEKGQELRLRKF